MRRMGLGRWGRGWAWACLLGVGGCEADATSGGALGDATPDATVLGDAADPGSPDDAAPDAGDTQGGDAGRALGELGPFRVGYQETSVTYEPADGSPARTLRLALWYPTDAETGAAVAYRGLLPAEDVLGDVPLAEIAEPLPLVVFSHGNTSFAEQSHFLTTFLASHGHVVAAPDHTGNSLGSGDPPVDMFHWRPLDLSAVLDHLLGAEAPARVAGRLTAKAALTGHSFGGYTALAASGGRIDVDYLGDLCDAGTLPTTGCSAIRAHDGLYRAGFGDPRVAAAVPMTPGAVLVFGEAGLEAVSVPTLLMTGDLDRTTPDATNGDPAWAVLGRSPQNRRVMFRTAGHFTFSNGCDIAAELLREDGCGEAFIPVARAHQVINALTLAFLRLHLRGDAGDASLLAAGDGLDAEVVVMEGSGAL